MIRKFSVFLVMVMVVLAVAGCGSQAKPEAPKADAPKYPAKSVEIIVPWAAGGATDVLFRALGSVFPKYANNQQLVIKNVPGGGAAIGYTEATKAKGDGYTIIATATPMITKIHMDNVQFATSSFAPVLLVADNACMIMVPDASPYKNLKDFVEDAKKRPDSITVGNGGAGGGTHLAALAFQNFAGIKLKHVPFEGGGPSITAALGSHVDAIMVSAPEGITQAQAGQLRILGVFGDSRLPKFPNVQTAKEQGMDFQVTMWRGILAPKDTPPALLTQIHDIFKKCMEDPDFKKKAEELSVELKYQGQAEFGKFLTAEDERYKNLMIKEKFGNRYKQ
jgi:tripartite-type tricarboxylate transporter receptor subunit TctC